MSIRIIAGDITEFDGDVIVNAAKPSLLGGGGVDGAIHRAAGIGLLASCRDIWCDRTSPEVADGTEDPIRCETGSVRPTPAFLLRSKWVFHTVGPVWPEDEDAERFEYAGLPCVSGATMKVGANRTTAGALARRQLRDCYKKVGLVAVGMDLRSIAFPAISAGVYGCPMSVCADIALRWAKDYIQDQGWPLDVTFYVFPELHLPVWQETAGRLGIRLG